MKLRVRADSNDLGPRLRWCNDSKVQIASRIADPKLQMDVYATELVYSAVSER